ncbi:hypothetical protein [Gorillibacterium sp. sgz5001074]|uniref:hypothetical protein n=1 Tax=Gorillibacterium sp. sgz5001074 TaxID=3446695 RepID=UPI003F66E2FB
MKRATAIMSALLGLTILLPGCSLPPKEALGKAFDNTVNLQSYSFESTFKLGLEGSQEALGDQAAMAAEVLKNADLKLTGAYTKEPFEMRMEYELNVKGDMNFGLKVPVYVTQDKLLVKVPNTPFLPLGKDVVGKYVEMDLKELNKQQAAVPSHVDMKRQQELSKEVLGVIGSHFDNKTFFKDVSKKDVTLPANADVKDLVKFTINDGNLDQAISVTTEKVLPEILKLLQDPKWSDIVGQNKDKLADTEKKLQDAMKNKDKAVSEFKAQAGIEDASMLVGMDSKGYIRFVSLNLAVNNKEAGQQGKVKVQMDTVFNQINEKVDSKLDVKASDIIKMEDFAAQMGRGF